MNNISMYSVSVEDINNEFSFKTRISKSEKSALIQPPNAKYQYMQNNYQYLQETKLSDYDTKVKVPATLVTQLTPSR